MKRLSLILSLAPLAILTPLLCHAGVAEHECACGDNVCCEESGEASCDVDPCASAATGRAECTASASVTTPCSAAPTVCATPLTPPPYAPPDGPAVGRLLPNAAVIHPILI